MSANIRKTLDDLPMFDSNPFDGKSDVPVYEFAVLIKTESPQTNPPNHSASPVAVVGTSADRQTIFYSRETYIRKDGSVFAVHGQSSGYDELTNLQAYISVYLGGQVRQAVRENS
jgi:hypothetical protein